MPFKLGTMFQGWISAFFDEFQVCTIIGTTEAKDRDRSKIDFKMFK